MEKAKPLFSVSVSLLAGYAFENFRILWLMREDVTAFLENQPNPTPRWHLRMRMRFAASAKYITQSSNAALQTWYRASVLKKPILLTLKSRKVYVGTPYASLEDPSRDFTFIKILPIRSGYRDADTKKITFFVDYKSLVDSAMDIENGAEDYVRLPSADGEPTIVDLNDMGIVITWKDIEILTIFDEAIYEEFQQQPPQ